MKKILPILVLISALSVSGSAAFYSVYGLSKLFAGASTQVMIMAGSLEIAKLVVATALHRYWKTISYLMRVYLSFSVVVLICITSLGIYGFLSSAYQITATQDSIVGRQIEVYELRKTNYEAQRGEYVTEQEQIVESISELRKSLSNPNQIQYIDRNTGQLITTTSSAARSSIELQLNDATERRSVLSERVESLTDSIIALDIRIFDTYSASESSSELGPLKYISGLTGRSMDQVVNWFIFLIIFVFDPLAVTLVILADHLLFKRRETIPDETIPDETIPDETIPDETIPDETIPDETIPDETIPDETIPDETIPDETTSYYSNSDVRRLFGTDISDGVVDHIRSILPPLNKPIKLQSTGSKQIPTLSQRQLANMSHQEIAEWYKTNFKYE